MTIDLSGGIKLETKQETKYLGAEGYWYDSAFLAKQSLVKEALGRLLEDENGSRMFSYEAAQVLVIRSGLVMKLLGQLEEGEREPGVLP